MKRLNFNHNRDTEQKLHEAGEVRAQFAKYVTLNVLSMLGISLYILADTFFVANGVGSRGLAALNLAIPVFSFFNATGLLLGMGSATQYAVFQGTGNSENGNAVFSLAIKIAVIFGAVLLLSGVFLSAPLSRFLGADDELFPYVVIYIRTLLIFSPAFLINNIMLCFIRNDGEPRLAMLAVLTGSFSNIILDYIFIYPLQMGMFGAAFATGLSPVLSLIILSRHFISKKNAFHYVNCKWSQHFARRIFSLGLPAFINEFSSGIVMLFFNFTILALSGNIGVAAYGVIANIVLVAISIFTGIAQGAQPLVSYRFGLKQEPVIRRLLTYALSAALGAAALLYFTAMSFPEEIIHVFNNENNMELQAIALEGMRIYFVALFFMGLNIVSSIFFTSVEKAFPSFVISISRGLGAVLPLIFILPTLFGMTGVWLVIPCAEFITLLLTMAFQLYYKKKNFTS